MTEETKQSEITPPKDGAQDKTRKHFDGSYQSHLFGGAGTYDKPAWSDSTGGRAAIQIISRGLVGAAMFTIGGRISRQHLATYNEHEFSFAEANEKPLQYIAKGFDVVFGKPIAAMARTFTSTKGLNAAEALAKKEAVAWNAVHFRPKAYYHVEPGKLSPVGGAMNGRSLGAEMVSVSFDFAMMSTGAATTRNLIQMIDPHIRKTWMVNDNGEMAKRGEASHFDLSKFLKSQRQTAWRVISKNQGEDWAVALPYVYQMRMQRKMLGKMFKKDYPGVKIGLDNQMNGAVFKVNNAGQIVGDHHIPGALDLHLRFVGYNVYTLMFREGYDKLYNSFKEWKENGYALKPHWPQHLDPILGVKNSVRYVAKSFIKANLYMNPAVVPFWLMRVPQSKWRGALIGTDIVRGENAIAHSLDSIAGQTGKNLSEIENLMVKPTKAGKEVFNFNAMSNRVVPGKDVPEMMRLGSQILPNPTAHVNVYSKELYKHYTPGAEKTFSQMLNPIGKASYTLGGLATQLSEHFPNWLKKPLESVEGSKGKFSAAARENFMRNYVDAATAYVPYFFAKSELGLRVDDRPGTGEAGKMDKAIYKLIDNVCALNPSKTGAAVKEIWRLSTTRDHISMRETSPGQPSTVVQAHGRHTERAPLTGTPVRAENTPPADKRWAETVMGKKLDAQYLTSNTQTRH